MPFRDACTDLLCFAQSWHWLAPDRRASEAARVLRQAGGGLAGGLTPGQMVSPGSRTTGTLWSPFAAKRDSPRAPYENATES
jgi:hypothetical protein